MFSRLNLFFFCQDSTLDESASTNEQQIVQEFEEFWSKNGEDIVWQNWVRLYGDYVVGGDQQQQQPQQGLPDGELEKGTKDGLVSDPIEIWQNIVSDEVGTETKDEATGVTDDDNHDDVAPDNASNDNDGISGELCGDSKPSLSSDIQAGQDVAGEAKPAENNSGWTLPSDGDSVVHGWGSPAVKSEAWNSGQSWLAGPEKNFGADVDVSAWGSTAVSSAEAWGSGSINNWTSVPANETENPAKSSVDLSEDEKVIIEKRLRFQLSSVIHTKFGSIRYNHGVTSGKGLVVLAN